MDFVGKQRIYSIMKKLDSNTSEWLNTYICESGYENESTQYIISHFIDDQFIKYMLQNISKLDTESFNDFIEIFSDNGGLCIVFRKKDSFPLMEHLEQRTLFYKDKVKIVQNILGEFTNYIDKPLMIQFTVLQLENICMSKQWEVTFDYKFQSMIHHIKNDITINNIYEQIALLFIFIFDNEWEKKRAIKTIIDKCNKHLYHSIAELCNDLERALEDKRGLFLLSDKAQNIKKKSKKIIIQVLFPLFFISLVLYGLYTLILSKDEKAGKEYTDVKIIGTREIETTVQAPVLDKEINIKNINIQLESNDEKEDKVEKKEITEENKIMETPLVEPEKDDNIEREPSNELENDSELQINKAMESYLRNLTIPSEDDIKYIIKKGENLAKICEFNYGNQSYYPALSIYNGIEDFNKVIIDQVIYLPNKYILDEIQKRRK